MRWEQVEDNYYKSWRLVRPCDERIVGRVSGSHHEEKEGWFAAVFLDERRNLGSYTTHQAAKKAVELAVDEAKKESVA